jgi:hypothetical protein
VEVIDMNENKPKKRGRPAKVVKEAIPDLPESPLKAMVIGTCNNPTWVRARIEGFGVNIKCPAQLSKRLIGKEVDVILVHADPQDYYQYLA